VNTQAGWLGVWALTLLGLAAAQRFSAPDSAWPVANSSGTSSRSTKLIHGGIRYLAHAFQNKLEFAVSAESTGPVSILTADQPRDGYLRLGAQAHYAFSIGWGGGRADPSERHHPQRRPRPVRLVRPAPHPCGAAAQDGLPVRRPRHVAIRSGRLGPTHHSARQRRVRSRTMHPLHNRVRPHLHRLPDRGSLPVTPTPKTIILQANAVPYRATLAMDQFLFFAVVLLSDPYAPLRATLYLHSAYGNADLYPSFTKHWPRAGEVGERFIVTTDALDERMIDIPNKDMPQPLPATLYIGMRALCNADISLPVRMPTASAPIELMPGQPHRGSVRTGQRAWCTFTPGALSTGGITFTMTPFSGETDLHVSPLKGFQDEDWHTCAHPSVGGHTCASSAQWNRGVDEVAIAPGSPLCCGREEGGELCEYKVLVWGTISADFLLTAHAQVEASAPPFPGGNPPAPGGGPQPFQTGRPQLVVTTFLIGTPTVGSVGNREDQYRYFAASVDSIRDIYLSRPAIGLACVVLLLGISLLALACVTTLVCRRLYARGQPCFVKSLSSHLPFGDGLFGFTSFNSERGGGRAQVGPTGPSQAVAGLHWMRMLDTAQEPIRYNAAPLVSVQTRMPRLAPRPRLVSSRLLGDAAPAQGSVTNTAPTPNGSAAALAASGLFTPQMAGGGAAPERSAVDKRVERLRARLAEAQSRAFTRYPKNRHMLSHTLRAGGERTPMRRGLSKGKKQGEAP